MLSFDSVAEAYGLIYPRPTGENFSFVDECQVSEGPQIFGARGLTY